MRRYKGRKVIYSLTIEHSHEHKNQENRLTRSQNSKFSSEKLKKQVRDIILSRLPEDMRKLFSINVDTEILDIQEGSLIFFFSVLFTGLNIIANYKNFYDSVQLLRKHCNRLIDSFLDRSYHGEFEASVVIEHPDLPEARYLPFSKFFRRRSKEFMHLFEEYFPNVYPSDFGIPRRSIRDGFFYFLLGLSIVSLTLIGILVYNAVVKVYFH